MTGNNENGTWAEYKLLVLEGLQTLKKLAEKYHELNTEIKLMKLKFLFLGAIAGVSSSGLKDLIVWFIERSQ